METKPESPHISHHDTLPLPSQLVPPFFFHSHHEHKDTKREKEVKQVGTSKKRRTSTSPRDQNDNDSPDSERELQHQIVQSQDHCLCYLQGLTTQLQEAVRKAATISEV